jgi:acyl-CoA synthetase (AMP-forming)/AMP-acid ligase II
MFHASAIPLSFVTTLRAGHTSYVMRRFELESFFCNMERYEITDLLAVPPMVVAMVMSPLAKKYSLRKTLSARIGAAPLDKGLQKRLKELLAPEATCTQVWGMTELSCVATMFLWPEGDETGSVGRFLSNLDAK